MTKSLHVGVVGLGRGIQLTEGTGPGSGVEVVALCDTDRSRLAAAGARLGIATYSSFGDLLGHDLDAVVLANSFHQHAQLAIDALDAGRHVLSETAACFTAAEAVALVRAVEASGLTYELAENYAFLPFVREMARLFAAGEVGALQYAEAEYVHPLGPGEFTALTTGPDHWRNWLPMIYYCSHALAPVITITGLRPVSVNGFSVRYDRNDPSLTMTARRADPAGVLMVELSDGSFAKLLQGTLRGGAVSIRLHGNRGSVENLRRDRDMIWLRKESWDTPDGTTVDQVYASPRPSASSGHGGSDALTMAHFGDVVHGRAAPLFDVYRAVELALVGILGYRSALGGSARVEIPDLRHQDERAAWASDTWAPGPGVPAPGHPWPSVLGPIMPTPEGRDFAAAIWSAPGKNRPPGASVEDA